MAGVTFLSAEVLLSKRVQDMVLNGEEPPPLYICRDGDANEDVSSASSSIPIIDLSLLSSSAPGSKQEEELENLRSALCSWGCFQVCTHYSIVFISRERSFLQFGRNTKLTCNSAIGYVIRFALVLMVTQ